MAIRRPWAFWRRVQYGSGLFLIILLIGSSSYLLLRDDTTSCFDDLQNGSETGTDCGGSCVRICTASVLPPQVLWVESFEIAPGQYNATAYVENLNDQAGVERLSYRFELYNGNRLVTERSGVTVFPPDSVYPIFEGRINTNGEEITSTRILIDPTMVWQPASIGREQFSVGGINLRGADQRPRLDAVVQNQELTEATDIEIVATLFNDAGSPLTSSQTFVDVIDGRSSEAVVFTWPNSIAKTVRSCTIPSDVVMAIDLSGSMNNDNDDPPQPITDATDAAAAFVSRLGEDDQVAVVTFASTALLTTPLTADKARASNIISELGIDPAEERGFTNTVSALELIRTELESNRRNLDARRAAIVLTDGLPTGSSETEDLMLEAAQVAAEIDAAGAAVYAIGLGENVDQEFIESIASTPAQAYFAPSGTELSQIYAGITGALCETGTARIDVIAKTPANFTPLR